MHPICCKTTCRHPILSRNLACPTQSHKRKRRDPHTCVRRACGKCVRVEKPSHDQRKNIEDQSGYTRRKLNTCQMHIVRATWHLHHLVRMRHTPPPSVDGLLSETAHASTLQRPQPPPLLRWCLTQLLFLDAGLRKKSVHNGERRWKRNCKYARSESCVILGLGSLS